MTEFFVPRTGEIVLSDGSKRVLVAGVREVDADVAADAAANRYGVKPVHEMTAAERVAHNLPPAAPDVDDSIKVEPEKPAVQQPAIVVKPAAANNPQATVATVARPIA